MYCPGHGQWIVKEKDQHSFSTAVPSCSFAVLFSYIDFGYMVLKMDFVSAALVDLEAMKQQLLNEVRCSSH